MSVITITEALGEVERIRPLLQKKQQFVQAFLLRPAQLRDPLGPLATTPQYLEREYRSIQILRERLVAIRRAIRLAYQETPVTIEGDTRSLADWLAWRREVLRKRLGFLNRLLKWIRCNRRLWEKAQRRGKVVQGSNRFPNLIVHLDEQELTTEIDRLTQTAGLLAGQLTLKNATVKVEIPDEPEWRTGMEEHLDGWVQWAASRVVGAALGESGNDPWLMEIRYLLALGQKIQAIKLVREKTGLGLVEAKNFVERPGMGYFLAN